MEIAYGIVVGTMDKLRPFLIKIFPIGFLRRAKKRYMEWGMRRLGKEKIAPFERRRHKDGINLIGDTRSHFGLGQSCRLLAGEIQASGIPLGICEQHPAGDPHAKGRGHGGKVIHGKGSGKGDSHAKGRGHGRTQPPGLKYNINIFHINAAEFAAAYYRLGKDMWDYRYNIAFWLWELEEFPREWAACIGLVDEIWTPSEFVSRAIRKVTEKPVITIPYHVEAPIDAKYDRAYFHLPKDAFLFLMMYDSCSIMERKNPAGALRAFKEAFQKEDRTVRLVIKMKGSSREEMAAIARLLDGYENVIFMTQELSKVEVNSLIAAVDVYVSMHRAEGFGLVMAEAMLNGTPCIATGWSANTEFMDADTACMLDYKLVPIQEDMGPFRKGNCWAEPDVHQAAAYMGRLYSDAGFYQRIAKNARLHAEKAFAMGRIAGRIKKRAREIYSNSPPQIRLKKH